MATNCESCSKLLSNCECCPRCLKDDYGCNCICESDEECLQNMGGKCHCRLRDYLEKKDVSKVDSYLAKYSNYGRVFDNNSLCIYEYTNNDDAICFNTVATIERFESGMVKNKYNCNLYLTFKKYKMEYVF
jgi:hypothetical protein